MPRRAVIASFFSFISIYYEIVPVVAYGKPCYPSDPTGNNPQNPCLPYPPAGIRSDSFVQGVGLPVIEIPTIQNPSGKELVKPNGFWTNSNSSGTTRLLRTSAGDEYIIRK